MSKVGFGRLCVVRMLTFSSACAGRDTAARGVYNGAQLEGGARGGKLCSAADWSSARTAERGARGAGRHARGSAAGRQPGGSISVNLSQRTAHNADRVAAGVCDASLLSSLLSQPTAVDSTCAQERPPAPTHAATSSQPSALPPRPPSNTSLSQLAGKAPPCTLVADDAAREQAARREAAKAERRKQHSAMVDRHLRGLALRLSCEPSTAPVVL